jgi:chromosome segregation ATPase
VDLIAESETLEAVLAQAEEQAAEVRGRIREVEQEIARVNRRLKEIAALAVVDANDLADAENARRALRRLQERADQLAGEMKRAEDAVAAATIEAFKNRRERARLEAQRWRTKVDTGFSAPSANATVRGPGEYVS